MKTSVKMLVAALAVFAITFTGIIPVDTNVAATTSDDTEYQIISDEDLKLFTDPRPVSKVSSVFDYVIDAEISIESIEPLVYSCTNISASVVNATTTGKYTASSIQSDQIDPYNEGLFYNETSNLFYLKVTAKMTFMAPEDPETHESYKSYSVSGVFMAPVIYEGPEIKADDITYDGKSHSFTEALSVSSGTLQLVYVSGDKTATNVKYQDGEIAEYSTEVKIKTLEKKVPPITKTWKIVPKELKDEYISLDPKEFEYDGNVHEPTITVKDSDISGKKSILKEGKDFEIVINESVLSATDVYDNYVITINGIGNYTGTAHATWIIKEPIPPIQIAGTLHVNDIYNNYFYDRSSLDGNIFIFPDEANTYEYGIYGTAIDSSAYYITIKDAWGQLVFSDNPDELTAAAENGIVPSNVTKSEWNWIRIDAAPGYTGSIIGNFTVHLDSNPEIGSKIVENSIIFTITSLDNKTASVTGYEEGIASALVIPDYVNGFKVTKIADKAFYGCKTITTLELGDYVSSIGVKAFTNCTKLQSVEFEDSLKTISAYAFYGCTRLADVSMDDSVKTIGSYAFYKCTALKNVNISGALKTLGGHAFSVSFIDADGKGITQTAKNLAGHSFEGSNKVLKLVV